MSLSRQESCWPVAPEHSSRRDDWHSACLSSTQEVLPLVEAVAGMMAGSGYPQKDVFGVRLALEEALVNSIKHGHGYDPAKRVEVRYSVTGERTLVEVEDEGEGFDPAEVPDPTEVENLARACGRGLMLMRAFLSWVRYAGRGNCVTLCKYPASPAGRSN